MDSPMQLFVDRSLPGCSGCRICEKMCALRHEKKWNPAYSRIKVYQFYPGPIDVPIVCQYCEDKPCVAACPFGALSYDSGEYLMNVDESLCT
ncbi:4Fe-4S dicluster domain-containing protein, partial [Candidatus Bathyarchaeota archaeon]|nr:4Fe-4S dicluster domain-containing protein [Candidatus Bathyarchaeota archaeon]